MKKKLSRLLIATAILFSCSNGKAEKFSTLLQQTQYQRSPEIPDFVCGDRFREYADFALDSPDYAQLYTSTPKQIPGPWVKDGDVVFVQTDMLEQFFNDIYHTINAKFILITHNEDLPAPGQFAPYLEDDNIVAWFGQNPSISAHPKFFPIPIGIANERWATGSKKTIATALIKKVQKNKLLYLNINIATYRTERLYVYNLFAAKPFCTTSMGKPFADYLENLASSVFVLSPRGNGLDCHRTWETLLMGSYPIVKTSPLDPIYEGLPVLIVQAWDHVTKELLEHARKQFESHSTSTKNRKLFMPYWIAKIKEQQQPYKETL